MVGTDLFFQFSTCFPCVSEVTKADTCADPEDQTSVGRNNVTGLVKDRSDEWFLVRIVTAYL